MRLGGLKRSKNVEDRRGMSPGMAVGGGGLGVLLLAGIAMLFGADRETITKLLGQRQKRAPQQQQRSEPVDDEARQFVDKILYSTETIWDEIFQEQVRGGNYAQPKLVMFSGQVRSGCGVAPSAVGPFYCPADQQVYLDPTFFDELRSRHNAPGDFAAAYVIAHEVAHHVQNQLGFSDKVNAVRQRFGPKSQESNKASVRLELQADYLAGVWAHKGQKQFNFLEEGDIEEGINAANQIGDDTLQKQATGRVMPERFTHGTSEQRVRWFAKGLQSGDVGQCQVLFDLPYEEL